MDIRVYNSLPKEAIELRTQVFVEEQGFSLDLEFDENENLATHIVGYYKSLPAATSRFFYTVKFDAYLIGRIVVKKDFRGMGLGSEIVTAAEEEIRKLNGKATVIHAQLRVKEFYESLGYTAFGDIDLEEGVEHIMMKKVIK